MSLPYMLGIMLRKFLKSKIHRVRVTKADLHYEGSITIDGALLEAADILPHEHVHVWNITSGARFETYALPGKRGSGTVQVNGAAAHHAKENDLIIVTSFATIPEEKVATHHPKIIFVDPKDNSITHLTRKSGHEAVAIN